MRLDTDRVRNLKRDYKVVGRPTRQQQEQWKSRWIQIPDPAKFEAQQDFINSTQHHPTRVPIRYDEDGNGYVPLKNLLYTDEGEPYYRHREELFAGELVEATRIRFAAAEVLPIDREVQPIDSRLRLP